MAARPRCARSGYLANGGRKRLPRQLGAALLKTRQTNSRSGLASFVFGLLGLTILPVLGSTLAIVFGHLALAPIYECGHTEKSYLDALSR